MRRHLRAEAKDLRQRELLCLEMAGECIIPEAAIGLQSLARNYGDAATQVEQLPVTTMQPGAIGLAVAR
jgi:hypothetical protein